MKNKKIFVECLIVFILVFLGLWLTSTINGDAIWNYGFSVNFLKGLIPYLDFNMVVTPFYPFVCSLFLRLHSSFLSFLIFNSLLVSILYYFSFKLKGEGAIIFILLLSIMSTPTYNLFLLFLMVLLIFLEKRNASPYLIGIVAAFCVLTKQSIFPPLIIALLIGCKKEDILKRSIGFLGPLLTFLIYLFHHQAFYSFLDYCFFGLSSFGTQNFTIDSILLFFIYIVMIAVLFIKLVQRKFRDRELLYILSFQVLAFPIFDCYHMGLCLCFDLFWFLDKISLRGLAKGIVFCYFVLCTFYRIFSTYDSDIVFSTKLELFQGKVISQSLEETLVNCAKEIQKNDVDKVFIFDDAAYILKLSLQYDINSFDLINYGNMGKKGYLGYIEKINKICDDNRCLFVLRSGDNTFSRQLCIELLEYVQNNYDFLYEKGGFEFYRNS